ncbi:MAG: NAD-dependent epimerase/dehydratase family protein [Aquabacterium sp.]|jgi:UDP-glucose 4-epimerase
MKCVILGGAGFIGLNLAEALVLAGHEVLCVDQASARGRFAEASLTHARLGALWGDAWHEELLKEALTGCDICFHLVSSTIPQTSNANPRHDAQSNLLGTISLLDACVKAKVRKVVFLSSGGTVYGVPKVVPIPEEHPTDPTCSYGIIKLAIEKYLEIYRNLHGLEHSIVRLSNPYGEHQRTTGAQGAVAVFLGKALRDETIEVWGNGNVSRDYVHISDVVACLMATMASSDPRARLLNVGSGKGCTINQLLKVIGDVVQRDLSISYVQERSFDVPSNILSIDRATTVLGWRPLIGLDQGVRRFATWLHQHESENA